MMVINETEHLFCGLCFVSVEKYLFKSSFHFLIKFLVVDVALLDLDTYEQKRQVSAPPDSKYIFFFLNLSKKEQDQDTSQSLVHTNLKSSWGGIV